MQLNAAINVARFVEEMAKRKLNMKQTARLCGTSADTLRAVLRGEFPHHMTTFFKIMEGLEIPVSEALVGVESHKMVSVPLSAVSGSLGHGRVRLTPVEQRLVDEAAGA